MLLYAVSISMHSTYVYVYIRDVRSSPVLTTLYDSQKIYHPSLKEISENSVMNFLNPLSLILQTKGSGSDHHRWVGTRTSSYG